MLALVSGHATFEELDLNGSTQMFAWVAFLGEVQSNPYKQQCQLKKCFIKEKALTIRIYCVLFRAW